jgi:hypothetical protein
VVFEVMVIEVIRISGVITNAGVIRIRLPIRNGFIRLASEWSGGSAAIAEEVSSTEDTNRELLAVHTRVHTRVAGHVIAISARRTSGWKRRARDPSRA